MVIEKKKKKTLTKLNHQQIGDLFCASLSMISCCMHKYLQLNLQQKLQWLEMEWGGVGLGAGFAFLTCLRVFTHVNKHNRTTFV